MPTHFRTCHLCEAMCGVAIEHDGDRILEVRGDASDPLSQGYICPKAVGLKDVHEDPDRLKTPLKREGDRFVPIPWAQAFDEVAARIKDVQARHGRRSIATYQGNPTVHNAGSMIFGQLFFRALHTPNNFSATSLDQLPHMLAGLKMFGHQLLLPVPDVDRTKFFMVLGANPVVSNGSLMSAPGMRRRIEAIKKRGGRVVVVDPRKSETAELADLHLPIRPGTDAWLLLALLQVILQNKGAQLGRLAKHVVGLDKLEALARDFSPERVAPITGIDAGVIKQLALDFMESPSGVAYGRVGVCTQAFGGLASWLVNALNIVTGRLDEPGGFMFTKPAIDVVSAATRAGMRGSFGRRKSRVRGLPEFGGELPTATLAEEIDTPGEGAIRALVTSCGNPVLSAPDGRRMERALASLELMVAIDIYQNETTRLAHYVLPPTFGVEHDHYDLAFHLLAVRNTAKYSPALFERQESQRHDWEIFLELATRLDPPLAGTMKRLVLGALGPRAIFDLGLRMGPYGTGYLPFGGGLSLAALEKEPHGVDLGPLVSCLPERLGEGVTIDVAPELYLADIPRLLASEKVERAELVLIGRRELRSNNSWMHNSPRLVKGARRCTLLMHPDDAEHRGLRDGVTVEVRSAVGMVKVELEVSAEMRPGVVSLPHGWGHDRSDAKLHVAAAHAGASINDLTDPAMVDVLSGTIAFSDVPVSVSATT